MRRLILRKGWVIAMTVFTLVAGGFELSSYYSPTKTKPADVADKCAK